MPPTIDIRITIPPGTTVNIVGSQDPGTAPEIDPVARYWREFLSQNAKKVFAAAARIEDHTDAGFTLEDIAKNLSIDYASVKSMHRTAGRTARRWREEAGTQEPIRFEDTGEYGTKPGYGGARTTYRLPPGVAQEILELDMQD